MNAEKGKAQLRKSILSARLRIFRAHFRFVLFQALFVALPVAALLVAVDQWFLGNRWSLGLGVAVAAVLILVPTVVAYVRLGSLFRSALTIDDKASLKSRISSAWYFLSQGDLNEARAAQVRDAIRHVEALDYRSVFSVRRQRSALWIPVLAALFVGSFFVPARVSGPSVEAAVEARKAIQINEIQALQKELAESVREEAGLEEVLERLKEIEHRYEHGETAERDMMIEMARLDLALKQKANQLGVENLASEVNSLVPQLMANDSSRPVAMALKEGDLEKAAKEMEKMADAVRKEALTQEEMEKLANTMGVAGAKLGAQSQGSFGGDFKNASELLKSSDSQAFSKSSQSIAGKMRSVKQYNNIKRMRSLLSLSKMNLGRDAKACAACNGTGKNCAMCNGSGKAGASASQQAGQGGAKGGLKAGTAASGSAFGEKSRLPESYRELMKLSGMAGDGPVDSEVELTEGQTSDSGIAVRDVYSEYASVAEEAIDRDEIPLSHRFHVKRYFQAIRPGE